MSLLNKVKSEVNVSNQTFVIYGAPGVGKSTMASGFPEPIFADIENGTRSLAVNRLGPEELPTYEKVLELLEDLRTKDHSYQTLVIDSLSTLETLISTYVLEVEFKNKFQDLADAGFGKGSAALVSEVENFMDKVKALTKRMTVVLIGHTRVKAFNDPTELSSYDRYLVQMNEKAAEKIFNNVDNVFLIKTQVSVVKDDKGKNKAIGSGERTMFTEDRPSAPAKNRLNLPSEIPASYAAVREAIESFTPKATQLIRDIEEMKSKADAKTLDSVNIALKRAGADVPQLQKIKVKLQSIAGMPTEKKGS